MNLEKSMALLRRVFRFSMHIVFSVGLIACVGVPLTKSGYGVTLFDGPPSLTCELVKKVALEEPIESGDTASINEIRNFSGKAGANFLRLFPRVAQAYRCSKYFGYIDVGEIQSDCDAKREMFACAEYASRALTELKNPPLALQYHQKACTAGYQLSCTQAGTIALFIKEEEELKNLSSRCEQKKSAEVCLSGAEIYYSKRDDLNQAIAYTKKGCVLGLNQWCSLHQTYSQEKLSKQKMKLDVYLNKKKIAADRQNAELQANSNFENTGRLIRQMRDNQESQNHSQMLQDQNSRIPSSINVKCRTQRGIFPGTIETDCRNW